MRILKRNLAFVLALVMALSLTAGAKVVEYTDHNDIAFAEAVEVLSAMGVLEGTDGVFNPTKVLNRAEAAKIVAYLMLGEKTASNLKAAEAPFVDVPVNHWAAGYIAYCVRAGLVKGVSATEYAPKAELTATQFAAMLLRACGYGANGEYEGFGWDVNVNKDALKLGVYNNNLGVDFGAGATREEAALYAFNTLNVTNVEFIKSLEIYRDVAGTMATNLYPGYKTADATDDFGREGYVWKNNKNETVTNVIATEADAVYTTEVKVEKIMKDLGLDEKQVANVKSNGGAVATKSGKDKIGGNGALVEVYVSDVENSTDKVVDVIIAYTYVGEVSADYDKDNEEITIKALSETTPVATAKFETETEYEKGDIVLFTYAADKVQSVKLAEAMEGKLTHRSTDKYVKLDGEKIEYSARPAKGNLNGAKLGEECVLYVDANGYAMYVGGVETKDEEIVLDGYVKIEKQKIEKDTFGDETGVLVKVTSFADGSSMTANLPLNKDGDKFIMVGTDEKEYEMPFSTTLTGVYGYYMNEDDEMVLVVPADYEYNKTMTIEFKGTRKAGAYQLNTKTVATVVNDDDVDTFEGYKNIKFKVEAQEVLLIKNGDILEEIYVLGEQAATDADEDIIVYFDGTSAEENTDGKYEIVVYNAKGETEEYVVASVPAAGVYAIDVNTDNEITATEAKTVLTVAAIEDEYFTAGGTKYYYAEDVVIHDVTDGIDADLEIKAIEKDAKVVVITDKDDDAVELVFIVG